VNDCINELQCVCVCVSDCVSDCVSKVMLSFYMSPYMLVTHWDVVCACHVMSCVCVHIISSYRCTLRCT
jgi:hypothetical protein